jgi:hypothetical protein
MAYIGKTPVLGNFVKLDAISVVDGQAAYTMQNGGVNFTSYDNVNQFLVSLNGILQSPTDSFTVSGSTLTFASNLSTGDVIDFVMVLGNTLDVGTPSDNTVTTAKLADSSVSLAKLTATGTKDATTFLRGDNTFASAGLSGWSEDGANNNLLPASASAGIYLGVNSATASNLLDDYEEGSFTTTLTSGLGASINSWNYTKIGNFVILTGKVTINSTDGASTHVGMSLPFNSSGRNSVTVNFVSGQNTGDIGLVAYSNNNSSMFFYNVNDNANESNHTNADVSNGDEYYITFTYRSA